jgi:hypothetical protein
LLGLPAQHTTPRTAPCRLCTDCCGRASEARRQVWPLRASQPDTRHAHTPHNLLGSRSSPLALAAASHPRSRLTVAVDERSLGFWALGYGRANATGAVQWCAHVWCVAGGGGCWSGTRTVQTASCMQLRRRQHTNALSDRRARAHPHTHPQACRLPSSAAAALRSPTCCQLWWRPASRVCRCCC